MQIHIKKCVSNLGVHFLISACHKQQQYLESKYIEKALDLIERMHSKIP